LNLTSVDNNHVREVVEAFDDALRFSVKITGERSKFVINKALCTRKSTRVMDSAEKVRSQLGCNESVYPFFTGPYILPGTIL